MRNRQKILELKEEIDSLSPNIDDRRADKQRDLELLLEEEIVLALDSIAGQLQTIAKYLSKQ